MGVIKTAAIVSLPILGLCATLLYFLYKKEKDDLEETLDEIKTSRVNTIEMKIPTSVIGIVIGRGGSNIKEVQQQTSTRINFHDGGDNEEYKTCYIRGTAEGTQLAEALLHEIITSQPLIEVYETWVPQKAVGRIIGRGGENIRYMSRTSNAKINVDSVSSSSAKNEELQKKRIVIKGTTDQIAVALSLIQAKVDEDNEARTKMEICQASRSPRNKQKSSSPSIPTDEKERKNESLIATGSDGILQVFVSAVSSPSCFWVQVYSSSAIELDRLVEEMTEYYSDEENKKLHVIKKFEIGQIVAASYKHDSKWYRAEVKGLESKNQNEEENLVDLFYVDYGDSSYMERSEILQLRTDFLKLRFQAIECSLANLKPSDGEKWSEKAIDVFEDLCHVAQWKPLLVNVVSCDAQPRGRRDGSPVPRVSLYDTSGSQDINIGEELIKQGFAVKEDTVKINSVNLNQSGETSPNRETPQALNLNTNLSQSGETSSYRETPEALNLNANLSQSGETSPYRETPEALNLNANLRQSGETSTYRETPEALNLNANLSQSGETCPYRETPKALNLNANLSQSGGTTQYNGTHKALNLNANLSDSDSPEMNPNRKTPQAVSFNANSVSLEKPTPCGGTPQADGLNASLSQSGENTPHSGTPLAKNFNSIN